jgi:signal transduction histidine kinase
MTPNMTSLARRYEMALRKHLKRGGLGRLPLARRMGRLAMTLNLETLDLARIHERALTALGVAGKSSSGREAMMRRAGRFFAEALVPIETTHRTARESDAHLNQLDHALRRRNVALASSNRRLKLEIAQRRSAEESLVESERHYGHLLEESQRMQERLRLLSRQLLLAQEEERKKISRELHDVIAQTLTGINVRLANLKKDALSNTKGLEQNIAQTQRLVERSVNIVHRFARELRPAVLDDLGLIPALHTFMKAFQRQTGIRITFSAFATVEQMNGDKRTVLYRVAQEALTNVARHAQASRVEVKIQKLNGVIRMKIKDDGKGFREDRVLNARKSKRLGLLGMRERLEMVGGSFSVASELGKGTAVLAQIPLANRPAGRSTSRVRRVSKTKL